MQYGRGTVVRLGFDSFGEYDVARVGTLLLVYGVVPVGAALWGCTVARVGKVV